MFQLLYLLTDTIIFNNNTNNNQYEFPGLQTVSIIKIFDLKIILLSLDFNTIQIWYGYAYLGFLHTR